MASDHQKKSRKSVLKKPVDTSKVNLDVVKIWLEETINEYLPDDDIVVEFIYELLKQDDKPDIHVIQEHMDGFLGPEDSLKFCEELWRLLLSGQKDPDGIPEQLLEQRKKQLERETTQQAQQMISQMRLRPDYRGRSEARFGGRNGREDRRSEDPGRDRRYGREERKYGRERREDNSRRGDRKKEIEGRNHGNRSESPDIQGRRHDSEGRDSWRDKEMKDRDLDDAKTNYNRSQKEARGTYQRDRTNMY